MISCQIHAEHIPRVSMPDLHHIWPLEYGGPNSPENRIVVCPTGHRNIHELLLEYKHRRRKPPWEIRKKYHPAERRYAQLGWDRIQRKAM